ncbi:MAG: hypothetical protein KDB01_07570 [Planctomycetaceae bacterium]|nr:hypothetical protein [Planctomycetaceae bacterium]
MLLAKLYTAQGAVPYWNENASAASDPLDLTTADELDGRLIRDADWNQLGRVEEVLLAPMDHWKIAYLSIAELRGNLRPEDRIPVPMGAFSRKTISPTWLLDVPEDFGLLTKTFEVGDWPQEIDRGWIEFSQEKYGRSALGGLVDLTHKDEEPLNTKNP